MPGLVRRLSIRDQIVAAMTLVIVVLAVLVGTTVMVNSRQEATARTQEANRELVHQLDSSMANLQSELMDITSLPYVSQTMSSIINPATEPHAESQEQILEALYAIMLSKSYISFIAAASPDSPGYYLATDKSFGLRPYDALSNSDILAEFIGSGKDFDCFLMSQSDTSILTSNRSDKLLFVRTLKDVRRSFKTVGYLLVGVPLARVTDGYLGLESDHLAIGLIDGRGNALAHSGADVALPLADGGMFDFFAPGDHRRAPGAIAGTGTTGDMSFKLAGTSYLMVYARENRLGWTTYYVTDEASLSPGLENVAVTIALVAAAGVAVFFVVAAIFTTTIVSPLDRLRGSMRRFEAGDFEQQVDVVRDDEIGQVLRGYNRMVQQIRSLIDQNYAVQLREKEAELTVLQSQMNPHLIYNTLDLIYWRAQAAGESDFARDIYALSQLLRLSVNRGHRWIGLRDEGEFLEHYLWLQNELMGSRLRYSVRFDEAVLPFQIPRFILQPLVENAVVHGLDERPHGGSLQVSASLQDGRLRILVCDDGEGLAPEIAQTVFHGPGTGHAVSNIRERLNIYFPDDWSWRVEANVGQGCRIELSLPAVEAPATSIIQPAQVGL